MLSIVPFTLGELLSLLAASLLGWYAITSIIAWYRLRHVPGPFLASFSWLWLARTASSGKQFSIYQNFRKYGSLARVGPNMLITDDPEVMRKLSSAKSTYHRDAWYNGGRWDPYVENMFTTTDPETHDKMKARLARAYGGRETEKLESRLDAQIESLLGLIRRKYLTGSPSQEQLYMDFATLSIFFTLDVITDLAFGEEFGYVNADSDLFGFREQVWSHWKALAMTVDVPWMRDIFYSSSFLRFLGPKVTDKSGMGKLMGVAHEVTQKKFESRVQDEKNMMGYFARSGLSQRECEAESIFMIVAGSDTTASAVRSGMLYIVTNPRIYDKMKVLISKMIHEGKAASPITSEQARDIPYLQAIIHETIRMRPPAVALFPKVLPPEGDMIDGKFIPGGTSIGVNFPALMQNTAIFGPDTAMFRPERFTEADEATRAEMMRVVQLGFGYGRWMCAGKPIALMELNKIFFELLRAFDFQLVNPVEPWDSLSYNVFLEENMWLKVTEAKLV
ncbi:cytochrome P450 [Xylariaceae sp. FL0662B]|nr:cytochrome P450 [Xylariaceae sp. FL0662B]